MQEEWRLIYFNRYAVSNLGRVRNATTLKVLRPGTTSRGYQSVLLYCGASPKRPRSFLVHRLVLTAFIGDSDLQCNHDDGNKKNNAITNLEYMTGAQNSQHAVTVLGFNVGERNGRAKLTDLQVQQIRLSAGRQVDIAKEFGISTKHVSNIRSGLYRKTQNARSA